MGLTAMRVLLIRGRTSLLPAEYDAKLGRLYAPMQPSGSVVVDDRADTHGVGDRHSAGRKNDQECFIALDKYVREDGDYHGSGDHPGREVHGATLPNVIAAGGRCL